MDQAGIKVFVYRRNESVNNVLATRFKGEIIAQVSRRTFLQLKLEYFHLHLRNKDGNWIENEISSKNS